MASAVTIATAYIVGGFIPLGPYMAMNVTAALPTSVALTLLSLAIFGYVKGQFTVSIGGLAATAAFMIARAIS